MFPSVHLGSIVPVQTDTKYANRLYDGWEEIADYYEITKRERARFKPGREMIEVWEWLVARNNLDSLPPTSI